MIIRKLESPNKYIQLLAVNGNTHIPRTGEWIKVENTMYAVDNVGYCYDEAGVVAVVEVI